MKKIIFFCVIIFCSTETARSQSQVTFYTSMGDFIVETYDTLQPITAGNFLNLVNAKFYDGVIFHRVIDGFMIQGGDPTGTGSGGPGYSIPDEFDPLTSNVQKAISMANAGPNTGGSQFFINLVDNLYLNPNYPVFGMVISNFSVVQSIGLVSTNSNDRPFNNVVMDSLRVTYKLSFAGIDNQEKAISNLRIFPNPANEQISVLLGEEIALGTDYSLTITNVLGCVIYSQNLTQKLSTIDVSKLDQKGVFFVNVTDENQHTKTSKKIALY